MKPSLPMQEMVRVRRVTSAALPQLLPLVREYWQFERIDGYDQAQVERSLRHLLEHASLGGAWLAYSNDTPVGYLLAVYVFSLEHLGLTAEIDEFFVRPGSRGSGAGDRLLAAAEAEFQAAGCTNVSLQVGRDNDGARRFYLQRGYAPRSGFQLLNKAL